MARHYSLLAFDFLDLATDKDGSKWWTPGEHIVHTLHINTHTQPGRRIHTCNTHKHAHMQTLLSAGKHSLSKQQPGDIISSSFLSCLQSDASKEDETQTERKKQPAEVSAFVFP